MRTDVLFLEVLLQLFNYKKIKVCPDTLRCKPFFVISLLPNMSRRAVTSLVVEASGEQPPRRRLRTKRKPKSAALWGLRIRSLTKQQQLFSRIGGGVASAMQCPLAVRIVCNTCLSGCSKHGVQGTCLCDSGGASAGTCANRITRP